MGLSLIVANAAQTPATKKKAAPKGTKLSAAQQRFRDRQVKSRNCQIICNKAGTLKSSAKAATKSSESQSSAAPRCRCSRPLTATKKFNRLSPTKVISVDPDGAWASESVEALKRFQKDQNLDPDGKIGSLSLIALGLGPKRGVASAQSAPAAVEPADASASSAAAAVKAFNP